MYYYFDGKEDLYAYVARVESGALFADVGPVPCPRERRIADAFWSTVEDYYLRLMTGLAATPQLAALIRGWIAASDDAVAGAGAAGAGSRRSCPGWNGSSPPVSASERCAPTCRPAC